MLLFHIIVLALLQGLTEFLPISSSAHLILVPKILGWPDQGLAFDVAVHVGTLAAVILYFRKTLVTLTIDWFSSVSRQQTVGESKLAWAILFGTIPVGLTGLLLGGLIETVMRNPLIIAATTIIFGLLLGWADWSGKRVRSEQQLTWRDVLFIGAAQAISLIPGTSRSGITLTAGLILGLTREAAARFSFLLSIPVIVLAGGLKTIELVKSPSIVDWSAMLFGALISGISAYLCIFLFMKMLQRIGMWPFVIYRLILGIVLIWLFI